MKSAMVIPFMLIFISGGFLLNCTNDTLLLSIALMAAGWLASND